MKKHLPMVRLVMVVFLAAVAFGAFAQDEATYVSNKQCKLCHNKSAEGEQWNKWKEMEHSKAYELLLSDEAKAVAKEEGLDEPPSEAPECLKCHVTGYKVLDKAAEEKGEKPVPDKIVIKDGVQCESCHGPASLHVKDGKKFKMSKDESIDMSAHVQRADEKLCKTCHNDESPTWNPERYTLEDDTKVGFDYEQAWKKIEHENPKKKD